MLAWLDSLSKPLKTLNGVFDSFRANTLYKLNFTSQIIYLEHFLNDQFDSVERRIFIDTTDDLGFKFIYQKAESKLKNAIFLASEGSPKKFFIKTFQEIVDTINFTVNVPTVVVFDEDIMRSKIDFYNQAGKIYTIITF